MNSIEIHPEARADILEAHLWYEERRPGLGGQFLLSVDAALERLQQYPRLGRLLRDPYRMTLVRRFPFLVIYKVVGDTLIALTMFHGHRKPWSGADRVSAPAMAYDPHLVAV